MKLRLQIPLLIALVLLAGAVFAESVGAGARPFAERNPRYRIATSDVLELNFRFTPEFNQTVTVQPDGFITLQSAGELKIAGLTLAEARTAITGQYASILHEPELTILLKEFQKPQFLVGGEVVKPGQYELRGATTLSDAITIAGGFSVNARQQQVLLFRRVGGDVVEVRKIDLKAAIEKGRLEEDIRLQSGDSIYVTRSFTGKLERFMNVTKLGMYFNPIPRF
jgi:polysaccharide export outer membrane protein